MFPQRIWDSIDLKIKGKEGRKATSRVSNAENRGLNMLLADKRMRENSKGMDSSKDLRVWNSKSALVGLVGGKEDVPKQK